MRHAFYESTLIHTNRPVWYHDCILTPKDTPPTPHWHEEIEIIFVMKGSLRFDYDGISFVIRENDMIIINSNSIHSFYLLSDDSTYGCLHVHPHFLKSYEFLLENISFFPVICHTEMSDRYSRIADIFEENKKEPSSIRNLKIQAEVLLLISHLIEYFSYYLSKTKQTCTDTNTVKMIILFIQEHLIEPITLKDVSNSVNFSKTYICKVFRQCLGMSIVDYINLMRCQHANALLKEHDYTIGECARFSGFSSMSYFSKTYQHYIGELPSDTRKSYDSQN